MTFFVCSSVYSKHACDMDCRCLAISTFLALALECFTTSETLSRIVFIEVATLRVVSPRDVLLLRWFSKILIKDLLIVSNFVEIVAKISFTPSSLMFWPASVRVELLVAVSILVLSVVIIKISCLDTNTSKLNI